VSRWPGVNWVWFPAVDSTNTFAERLMEAWFAEELETPLPPTLIFADAQWAGRGRGERTWQSPPGGLYASFLFWVPTSFLPWLPLAAGLALYQGVKRLLPELSVALKWPNDLQVKGRKLGGVLCSSRVQGPRAWTVTGVGINVLTCPVLGEEGREPVSLRQLGFSGTLHQAREVLLDTFVTAFPALLEEGGALVPRWEAVAVHVPGEAMAVRTGRGVVFGTFRGLSPEGLLLLEVGGGVQAISALELA